MKVTDLMIGDFVNCNDLPLRVGAIRQDEIGFFDNDYKLYWCSDDEFDRIDPIPLTEDILTKNGFLKRSGKEYYLKDDIVIFVGSDSCEVCTLYGEYTAYSYVEEGYTTIATIHYIHQLQHLLRLCGINKEIEL